MIASNSFHSSEPYLQTIVENLEEGVLLSDMSGRLLFVNPAALTMVGLNSTDEYLRNVSEFADSFELSLLNGSVLSTDQWPLARVLRGEKLQGVELVLRHLRAGWQRTLSFRGTCAYDTTAQATLAVITMTDIGERMRREARFRALIEHSSDSIALISAENKILYLSPAVTAVEGYLPEELLGHSGIELTHPDDLPVIKAVMDKLVANPGQPFPALWRRRHKNGHWIWLEGVATNLLGDPSVAAIVTNYRDVSSRIQQEEKIHTQLGHLALLDQITRAIAERQGLQEILQVALNNLEAGLPLDFGCVMLFDPVKHLLTAGCIGAHSHELAIQLELHEQASIPIDKNGLAACVAGALVYEADLAAIAFPFPARLNSAGLNSLVLVPLSSGKRVFGLFVAARRRVNGFTSSECEFMRQLSEHIALSANQTQLYNSLQQAYDELHQTQAAMVQEERLRVLGQMASGIAHDINNALTPMLLYTEMLLESERNLSDAGRHYLEIIQRSVSDAAQTVVRMREFSRPHDESMPLLPVQLNQLVQHAIELTQVRWRDIPMQTGVVIEIQKLLAAALPTIAGVESEIREALTNLIFNAIDAMPDGGTLILRTIAGEGPSPYVSGKWVAVEVGDTGIGMSEQTRQRCLEPFFTTKGGQGTGLGLPMVFGTVQRHNAHFEIDSTLGAGTTMRLIFPIAADLTLDDAVVAESSRNLPPLNLLLIDDDPILLESLRDVLQSDGHTVTTASGGKQGIESFKLALASTTPFAAVITDLGMPYVDGRQVASEIKQMAPTVPVLLITGWGQRLLEDGTAPEHVDRVLAKPPKLALLRAALADLCLPIFPAIDGFRGRL